jgi:hypothetical protein
MMGLPLILLMVGHPKTAKPFGGFCIGVDKVTKVWIKFFYPQKD